MLQQLVHIVPSGLLSVKSRDINSMQSDVRRFRTVTGCVRLDHIKNESTRTDLKYSQ
jgi:hypothetical protein